MTLLPGSDDWRAAMQDVSAAIDDAFGELVTITPVRFDKANFPHIPEPEKAVTVRAVFTRKAATIAMGPRGRSDVPHISTSHPVFQFRFEVFPTIRQGFWIKLHRTGETFEATDVQSDGVSRITVPVVQLDRQKEDKMRREAAPPQQPSVQTLSPPPIIRNAPALPRHDPRIPRNELR